MGQMVVHVVRPKIFVDYGAIIDLSLSCSNILTIDGIDYEEMDSAPLVGHSASPDPPPPPPTTTTTTMVVVETGIDWFWGRDFLIDSCCEENVGVKNAKAKIFPARNSRFCGVQWTVHWVDGSLN